MAELFTSLERAAWGGFVAAQSRLFQLIEDDLRRRFHITHAEFEVLLRLAFAPEGRARIQDLAARSLLSRSGTSRAVERLAKAGHVERHDAEEDGRGAYAVLTPSGRKHFFEAAREHVAVVRREYLSHFTAAEQAQLAAFWERLTPGKHAGAKAPSSPSKAASKSAPARRPRASKPARSAR